ncbi:MAG: cytochrome P460 family protein [Terriglobales bacterium]
MITHTKAALLAAITMFACILLVGQDYSAPKTSSDYNSSGQMKLPAQYREWVYLTTGFDMSYNPQLASMNHSMFDNVFVNPEAYKKFLETGRWPDKTVMVLEARMAEGKGSINQKGHYQGEQVMAREVHVKDEARFPGKWAFFAFGDGDTGTLVPTSADCYSCHSAHAAVDTTFVQFYPTLLGVAKAKGTLSAAYVKETAKGTAK